MEQIAPRLLMPAARSRRISKYRILFSFPTPLAHKDQIRSYLGGDSTPAACRKQGGELRCQGKVEMSPPWQSRNVAFSLDALGVRVNLRVPVKRRRALLASNPIKE